MSDVINDDVPEPEMLKRLMRLAWDNGFDGYYWLQNSKDEFIDPEYLSIYWDDGEQYISHEEMLFSHDFIKALCKAKYGDAGIEEKRFYGDVNLGGDVCCSRFEETLCNLAISTNRIEYLYGVFIEPYSKEERIKQLENEIAEHLKEDE